jgi:molecular chaperone HtpG
VVDSEDLPLNVSRETVQNNRMMRQLGKMIKGRVLRELKKLGENEPQKYKNFWKEFGRNLKEGIAIDPMAKEEIIPFFRYTTSKSEGDEISLDTYIERMADDQTEIYFVLGDSNSSVANSPHLDPFKSRELEVLYWTDPLDALIAPSMQEYNEKPFKNIDDAEIKLPEQEDEEEDKGEEVIAEAAFNRFVGRCVTTLGDRVTEVRASKVLKDSPVRLVSPADEQNREMHRIQRMLSDEYEVPKKIMEINRSHPLIADLAQLIGDEPDAELINLSIEQLYDSALIQEGLHPNPADILPRVQKLLAIAAAKNGK